MPAEIGYAPSWLLNGSFSAEPPQHVLDQLGGSYDQSRYYWNPDTYSLVDRYTGGSYSYDRADPANGTDVITNYGNADQQTLHYGAGQTPYFGFGDSAQGYNGGDAPNSGTFISADPNAIGDYQSHRQDVVNRGVAQVGALVGGAALGGALGGGGTTAASQSYTAPGAVAGTSATLPSVSGMVPAVGSALGATAPAAAGALGGLGLGGWLTVGALGAQALQGNKDITTNQTNAPPAYIAPYLSGAAEQASNLYGQGNYVAPVTQSAIDYGSNVLNGSYLNSNPYLDDTFKRAAGAVTNQVQSNFGLSGRNARGVDAAGFAQEGYNDLANQIYGGNYQAERQRQQQILPYAGQLGAYTNPGTALDDYIARLRNLSGGYGTQTSTTPTQSNWLGGLAGLGLALMG